MLENNLELNFLDRKTVALVSEYNGLSISLIEKLLSLFFRVKVFCVEKDLWFLKAPYLKNNSLLSFADFGINNFDFDYLIFVSQFFDNVGNKDLKRSVLEEKARIDFVFSYLRISERSFFLLPYSVFDNLGISLASLYHNYLESKKYSNNSIVYLGNIVGPRVILNSRDELLAILSNLLGFNISEIPFSMNSYVRPTRLGGATRKVVSLLTNKVQDSQRIIISGEAVTLGGWLEQVGLANVGFNFSSTTLEKKNGLFESEILLDEFVNLDFLNQTLKWFKDNKGDDFYIDKSFFGYQAQILDERLLYQKQVKEKFFWINTKSLGLLVEFISRKVEKVYLLSSYLLSFIYSWICKLWTWLNYLIYFSGSKSKQLLLSLRGINRKIEHKILAIKRNNIVQVKIKSFLENFGKFSVPTFSKRRKSLPMFFNFSFLKKYVVFFASVLATLILVPSVSLVLSFLSLYFGQKFLREGQFYRAKQLFYSGRELSNFSLSQFYFYSDIDFLGGLFITPAKLSNISFQSSETALLSIEALQKISSFFEYTIGNKENSSNYSQDLVANLDTIYKQVSFLDGQLKEVLDNWPLSYLSSYLDKIDLRRRREEIKTAKTAFSLVNRIFGEDREKNYLLLFQNNMELRPTGGFIGSFAIVGFNKGKMTRFEVYDVYDADGQLKGYVEPPWQLREYLNQPAWYLRDSNWDPDFPKSAQRAEWFLDKSLGIQVDGVISIDLVFARDLVRVFDSIWVADFNKGVSFDNFYEVVQYESEKNFFPGSRQKGNFLTALSRSLLNNIKSADKKHLLKVFEYVYKNLNSRHIQIFLHEPSLQEEIDNLGWSGSVRDLRCFIDNCLYDWVSLIEANVGVNKSNYFVDRSLKVDVEITQDSIKRKLEVVFNNNANTLIQERGKYKAYVRLLLPLDSIPKKVAFSGYTGTSDISFKEETISGRKEIGFLLELYPLERKTFIFEWESERKVDLTRSGEYRFYLRKQAGVESFPFALQVSFPHNLGVSNNQGFQLTNEGAFVYNLNSLKEDFYSRFYW